MRITDIQTAQIHVPLKTPFKTALRTVERIEDIIVIIKTEEGLAGYGEAPPTAVITGDTKGSVLCAINDFIKPALLGMDIENIEEIMFTLHSSMKGNTSAKAAVDMALYDLYAKRFQVPLYQILGGMKTELETDITISVNSVEEMVQDSLKAVNSGFNILKIKVGKDSEYDIKRISAIREAVGPSIKLRVDANQGWTAKQAIRIISAMEDKGLDIELVEQPVKAHDLLGMKAITNQVYTPILADESVFSLDDAIHIVKDHVADYINIKLMKTGGIYKALQICAIAQEYDVKCMIGCMLETKLAVSAAAHLGCAKGIITMADLDGPALCKEDPYVGGPEYTDNKITMNQNPGIGITQIKGLIF